MNDMPTSPVSEAKAEREFGYAPAPQLSVPPAPTIGAEWRRLGAFLKRPTLDSTTKAGSPFVVLGRIYLLDMMVMLALITLAGAAIAAGIDLPKTAIADVEITIGVGLLVVIGAPVMEELMFRGWLSGRPSHVFSVGAIALGLTLTWVFRQTETNAALVFSILGIFAGFLALVFLHKRPPMRWFTALFPGMFWLAASAFALIHIANFSEGSILMLLPLVLPQFVLGTLLGYVRVKIGLWSAILLHAAHNATALGIAALAMSAETAA